MTYFRHLKAGAAATALVTALVASAATGVGEAEAGVLFLDPVGGSGLMPNGPINDILESIYGAGVTNRGGYYGSTIRLAGKTAVTFTFLGFEAGYDNEFLLDADGNGSFDLIFSNKSGGGTDVNGKAKTAVGDTYTVELDPADFTAGIIPFLFKADVNAAKGLLANGDANDANDGLVNFFTSYDGNPTAISGSSLVVFFDDGGAGVDSDYDDMAIRIAAAVPEPGTIAILGLGLLALGWIVIRRKEDVSSLKNKG